MTNEEKDELLITLLQEKVERLELMLATAEKQLSNAFEYQHKLENDIEALQYKEKAPNDCEHRGEPNRQAFDRARIESLFIAAMKYDIITIGDDTAYMYGKTCLGFCRGEVFDKLLASENEAMLHEIETAVRQAYKAED